MTFYKDGDITLHVSETEQVYPQGNPPIFVEKKLCDECKKIHDFYKCPKCGAWITEGFGLMGGGFGSYQFCNNEDCDWFRKECLPLDEC